VRPADNIDHSEVSEDAMEVDAASADPPPGSARSVPWEKAAHQLSPAEEKKAATNMDEEQHSEHEFDALQAELEETRRQRDKQMRQLLTLQQEMEERRQKEESLLRRMRELVVPLAATTRTRTVASCVEALVPPPP